MSPNSASRAEKLGYTNVKVYHAGIPAWTKGSFTVLSAKQLKEGWIEGDRPHVLVDVRTAAEAAKGFIRGAVTLPAAEVAKSIDTFPPKNKKPPIMLYDQSGGADARSAAQALVDAGYPMVNVILGGMDAWKAAGGAVETGSLATAMTYVPKPKPGSIAIEEFKKIAAGGQGDALILDVRNREEGSAGMIKGALLVPDEEVLDRLAEIPKDKLIVTHCSTGVRAEMAYHKLKERGYKVKFLNAKIDINEDGSFTIDES